MRKSSVFVFGPAIALMCVGLIMPQTLLARGGGGHGGGGHGGGGHFGGGGGFRGGEGGFRGGEGRGERGDGFRGGEGERGFEGGWGSGYRGGSTGDRVGRIDPGGPRMPVSPGWRGGRMPRDRFDRFRRGEFGGYGGWGYWLGDGYWGFNYPWWLGGFPFWYADLSYADYSNPYYDMNPVDYGNYDYGVPIQQASSEPSEEEDPSFLAARDAFRAGNYQEALTEINKAMASEPQDQDIHEFHALILFALGDYQKAAAVTYDVLNAGPGWDWTILESFYPSVDVYTKQLRALEHYVSQHDSQAGPRFLLGDQYLMLGHWDAAKRQFAHVAELEPQDRLAKNILAGLDRLGKGPSNAAAASGSAGETSPITQTSGTNEKAASLSEQSLAGTWKSRPAPKVTVELALRSDHTFTWSVNQNGKAQTFTGNYQLQGDDLSLTRQDGEKMDGELTQQGSGAIHFRLKNAGPNDPGLEFMK